MAGLALQHYPGGPQNVPGIVKGGQQILAEAHAEHLIAGLGVPGVGQPVQVRMGEEGIFHDAQVQSLGAHHVHGIMQHHFRQGGGGGRHEYFRRGLLLLQHGQGAQMVQMGMAQENGFHGIGFQNVKLRHGRQPLPLGVHPAVKHYPGAVHFKQITIGPDLFGPADIRKTDHYYAAGE